MNSDHIKEKIFQNIGHPFFHNNEGFIELFDTLYRADKDIKILLLMYNKGISYLYHYLYLELCDYYKDKNRELCRYILEKAIKRNVYDQNKILLEYEKYRNVEYTKSENEFYRILHPKKLFLWGKEWIPCSSKCISTTFELENRYASYAEYVVSKYCTKQNNDSRDSLRIHSFSLNLEKSIARESYIPRKSELELANKKSVELFDSTLFENTKIDDTIRKSNAPLNAKTCFVPFTDRIEIGKYIEIGDYVYFVSDEIANNIYSVKKIAKNTDKLVTIVTEEFCMQEVQDTDIAALENYSCNIFPSVYLKCRNHDLQYIIYKNEDYHTLKTIFKLFIKEHGVVEEAVAAYFYLQIHNIICALEEQNIYLNNITLDDFLRSKQNTLMLCKYDFGTQNSNSGIFKKILKLTRLKKFKYLEDYSNDNIARLENDLKQLNLDNSVFVKINLLL